MNPVIYLIICFNLLILNDLNNAYRYHSKTLCLLGLDLKLVSHLIWHYYKFTIHFKSLRIYVTISLPCDDLYEGHVYANISWDIKFVSQLCKCSVTLLQYLIWVMTWYFSLDLGIY